MQNNSERSSGCCSCGSGCCGGGHGQKTDKKQVVIDFLYLDLNVCEWCKGTDKSLEEALENVSKVLQASDTEVIVNKINVTSEELAMKHRFISSPTIRVNGRDIQMELRESLCDSCGDLCGDSVDCRVWIYNGEEYTIPPKALIIDGILKSVYGGDVFPIDEAEYVLPENLKKFFAAMNEKRKVEKMSGNNGCSCGNAENKCC